MFFGKNHKNIDYVRFLESYGRFTLENPSASRQQRQKAIRRLLDIAQKSSYQNQNPCSTKKD